MRNFFTLVLIALFLPVFSFGQYCTTSNTFGDYRSIGGVVTTGGITNINNGPSTNQSGVNGVGQPSYRNYTSYSVSQYAGSTINLQLWTTQYSQAGGTYSQSYAQYYYVWVDWNNDFDFTDPGEYMNINPASTLPNVTPLYIAANSTGYGTLTIPATATPGVKRMRIRSNESNYAATLPGMPGLSTCGSINNRGETEDYSLEVLAVCNIIPGVITASPGNSACVSGNPTLSLSGTTTGSNISYQWKSSPDGTHWTNVGTNATSYSPGTLTSTTYFKVIINCTATTSTKDSTPVFVYTVNPIVTPSVSITSDAGTITCPGTQVTFTATPVNGGVSPNYQWKKNGINTGTNSDTYTDNSLASTDVITVTMTSNAPCATPAIVVSNSISVTITPAVTPGVTIAPSPGNTICSGMPVTFTATPANGGNAPSYQWKLNGINVGTNAPTYTNNLVADGDIITVELGSNANCATPPSVTSPAVTMTVNPILTPSVVVDQTPDGTLCSGMPASFTALPVHEGTAPVYVWKKNGITIANGISYTDNNLNDGDIITCTLTSNVSCASVSTVTSMNHIVDVGVTNFPQVSITANPGTHLFDGQQVTFTASVTDGGPNPDIYWQKNSVNIPNAHGLTYTTNDLKPGDTIICLVISKYLCAIPNLGKSNKMAITSATGVNSTDPNNDIRLYPNPNKGVFTIAGDIPASSDAEIQVTDIVGRIIYKDKMFINHTFSKEIDMQGNILPGTYFLQIKTGEKTMVLRFVIQ